MTSKTVKSKRGTGDISRVLVTNAQLRSGLAVIRSLGEKGIKVTGSDSERCSTGFFSKYCAKRLIYPDPRKNEVEYVKRILDEIKRTRYDVVLPINDHTTIPLSKYKNEIEKYSRFPFQEYEKLKLGRDKALTVKIARDCGVRVPDTVIVDNEKDLVHAEETLGFPLIIRPRLSSGSRGLHKIENRGQLEVVYHQLSKDFALLMAQEYIPWGGLTYDVGVIMNSESIPRAVFVSNRLRTYPVSAGPNVVGEGVYYPEIKEEAIKLLRSIDWIGPAQVEFRIDPRNNAPVLMEINPRLWGSMYLGIISGIDFPYLMYKFAIEGDIEPVTEYKLGIKARWFWPGDILHLIFNPNKREAIKPWLKDFFDPNTKMYIPSRDDPFPLFGRLLAMLVYSVNKNKMRYLLRLDGERNR